MALRKDWNSAAGEFDGVASIFQLGFKELPLIALDFYILVLDGAAHPTFLLQDFSQGL